MHDFLRGTGHEDRRFTPHGSRPAYTMREGWDQLRRASSAGGRSAASAQLAEDRDRRRTIPSRMRHERRRRDACAATSTQYSTPRSAWPAPAAWTCVPRDLIRLTGLSEACARHTEGRDWVAGLAGVPPAEMDKFDTAELDRNGRRAWSKTKPAASAADFARRDARRTPLPCSGSTSADSASTVPGINPKLKLRRSRSARGRSSFAMAQMTMTRATSTSYWFFGFVSSLHCVQMCGPGRAHL